MVTEQDRIDVGDELGPGAAPRTLLALLLASLGGVLLALLVLPHWLPGLSGSLLGAEPKGYWYLARASAWVAFVLLWLSMAMGLLITNRLARVWPGGPAAFDLHQHVSLLALGFGVFHALVLLGDHYIGYALSSLLIPFSGADYRPFAVGLGQLGLYGLALVGLSFYLRPYLGTRRWRQLHFLSFAVFLLVLAHGIFSGSDTGAGWAQSAYWLSAGSLLFLTVYRVLVRRAGRTTPPPNPLREPVA